MSILVASRGSRTLGLLVLAATMLLSSGPAAQAGEQRIVLRDYVEQAWKNELLTWPLTAPKGECHPHSVALAGPKGAVAFQLSRIESWPGTESVKSAEISFIADLAPLATDTYTIRYGPDPVAARVPATDLAITPGEGQVEITTRGFGVRLLQGEKTYEQPVPAADVPGPVIGARMADGTWFGGSRMFGPGKIAAWSATLTDSGPVFARVVVRYSHAAGNTMELAVQVAAGDNTMRMESRVREDQPTDGFDLIVSRGLPPLLLQVQDELRKDRPCFMNPERGFGKGLAWAEIPLKDYVAPVKSTWPWPPDGKLKGLVTLLSPWEDWFTTFTQARIRLKLEETTRELQIRSLDPGAWVEPVDIQAIFDPALDPDPAKGMWLAWTRKCMPLLRDPTGEIALRVNAREGVRKWTVSDCLSMPGVAALFHYYQYRPESEFPPETRPAVGYRLNEVKDYVLEWPGDEGTHPRLFMDRSELQALWAREVADPALVARLTDRGTGPGSYAPNSSTNAAVGAYLLSGGSSEVIAKTQLLTRLRNALAYELWGIQFGAAGAPAPILYDALIDGPAVPEAERPLLRARMAYYAYRLADPKVWSAERGYCSGNQNMTVTWEISRGLAACAIPEHPMAKVWYRKAQRVMEHFLTHMVGPAGEWPEAMSHHGRQSIDMILAFAIASSNSGMHDYVNDPRVKRMVMYWAKMATPRDPRPRGIHWATPNRRYCPSMGRDGIGFPGGTCGAMARATRESDPAYSAVMQWAWLEEGGIARFSHLGGFSHVSCDRRLPAEMPEWQSEVLPYAGAILRHGLGTPDEHQVMLYSGDHFAAFYPGHTGSFPTVFAYGTPVAGLFAGFYAYQEGFLASTVDLARGLGSQEERMVHGYHGRAANANMWSWPKGQTARFGEHGGLANVSAFSTLSRQDYAAVDVARHHARRHKRKWLTDLPAWPPVRAKGKPPVDWRRQTLFLKDDDPSRTAYLLIRDSVKGGQPTTWQMWTVSETVDTPAKVKDVAAVLADKPGHKILPARELTGDRFTAIGQLGVDVEYYIASPSDTPRHTLRYGEHIFDGSNKLLEPEYQDLLHLQLPRDGVYYVAFFPRKRNTPAPSFSTLGGGTIINVTGDFGTDYGFLSAQDAAASEEGVSFRGTAASVQDRAGELVLTLGAKGEVEYGGYRLAADFPATLRVQGKELSVELPKSIQPSAFELAQPFPGGTVTVATPAVLRLAERLPGVRLTASAAGYVLKVPAGLAAVALIAGKGH